jgi:hypothetical protein
MYKKFEPIYNICLVFYTQKLLLSFQKYRFGILVPEKLNPHPGSKKHRIPDLEHCIARGRENGLKEKRSTLKAAFN